MNDMTPVPARPVRACAPGPAPLRYLRMRRCTVPGPDGFAQGGWWPRSRNLVGELRPLLADLHGEGCRIVRVAYHAGAWQAAPEAMAVSGRVTLLAADAGLRRHVVSFFPAGAATGRIDLVVVPPATGRRIAERILRLAEGGGDISRIVGILARGAARPRPQAGVITIGVHRGAARTAERAGGSEAEA